MGLDMVHLVRVSQEGLAVPALVGLRRRDSFFFALCEPTARAAKCDSRTIPTRGSRWAKLRCTSTVADDSSTKRPSWVRAKWTDGWSGSRATAAKSPRVSWSLARASRGAHAVDFGSCERLCQTLYVPFDGGPWKKKDCAQRLLLTLWILWVHHAHDVHQFTCNSWVRLCLVCDKLALHAFVQFHGQVLAGYITHG